MKTKKEEKNADKNLRESRNLDVEKANSPHQSKRTVGDESQFAPKWCRSCTKLTPLWYKQFEMVSLREYWCNYQKQSATRSRLIDMWCVQCGECYKWRVIPTQQEYEEIRSKFIQDPFICSKKGSTSCDDRGDIEYDNSRTWVIDKPNIPKTPAGFKRTMVMRKDYSRLDCYYDTPNGKRLRSSREVPAFLDKNPEYKQHISAKDFSFHRPKIMEDTIPKD